MCLLSGTLPHAVSRTWAAKKKSGVWSTTCRWSLNTSKTWSVCYLRLHGNIISTAWRVVNPHSCSLFFTSAWHFAYQINAQLGLGWVEWTFPTSIRRPCRTSGACHCLVEGWPQSVHNGWPSGSCKHGYDLDCEASSCHSDPLEGCFFASPEMCKMAFSFRSGQLIQLWSSQTLNRPRAKSYYVIEVENRDQLGLKFPDVLCFLGWKLV